MLFWTKFLKQGEVLLFNKNGLIYSLAKLNLNGIWVHDVQIFNEDYIVSVKFLRIPINKTFRGIIKKSIKNFKSSLNFTV